jgi:hypothetical protein
MCGAKIKNVFQASTPLSCTSKRKTGKHQPAGLPTSRFTTKLGFPILWRLPPTQGSHPLPPIYVSRKQALASGLAYCQLTYILVRHTTQPHKDQVGGKHTAPAQCLMLLQVHLVSDVTTSASINPDHERILVFLLSQTSA